MEHVISNVMSHLEAYIILSSDQFGFCKNTYSAELQLLQTVHDIAVSLSNKSQCEVVLFDFSKAYDRVCHHHLVLKLNH